MPASGIATSAVLKNCLLRNGMAWATELASRVVAMPGRDVGQSEFLAELRVRVRPGALLSPQDFKELFTTIVLARYRYLEDRLDAGLVSYFRLYIYVPIFLLR